MRTARELVETAQVLIANVSNGDWSMQSPQWQTAAQKWREDYNELVTPQREMMKSLDDILTVRVAPDVKALIVADLKARL